MTEMEKLVVMFVVGFILTFTLTGAVILDIKWRQRERANAYPQVMDYSIPFKGTLP